MSSSRHADHSPDFDRVARLYRWAEYLALGPLLQQTRIALLHQLDGSRHAVLFGDGDGRFLARLLARYPALQATAVDTSGAMLRLLRMRCSRIRTQNTPAVVTVQSAAQDFALPAGTDLIVTHFFLDCLTQAEVESLVERVAGSVVPGTRWLLSDFGIPSAPVCRGAARLYIRSLYFAFRLLTGLRVQKLPDPQTALANHGFRRLTRRTRLLGLLYSELWEFSGYQPLRHNPPAAGFIHKAMQPAAPLTDQFGDLSSRRSGLSQGSSPDPQPDPEPAVPSLPEPDPGVFRHEPAKQPSHPSGTPADLESL